MTKEQIQNALAAFANGNSTHISLELFEKLSRDVSQQLPFDKKLLITSKRYSWLN